MKSNFFCSEQKHLKPFSLLFRFNKDVEAEFYEEKAVKKIMDNLLC